MWQAKQENRDRRLATAPYSKLLIAIIKRAELDALAGNQDAVAFFYSDWYDTMLGALGMPGGIRPTTLRAKSQSGRQLTKAGEL